VEQGDPHKIKKSAGYKFRAAKRRAWQKNTGTSKRDDEDFNTLWGRVQRQEALLNLIQKDGKARPCSHWSPYDRVRVVNAVP
jgi:amphiphysin